MPILQILGYKSPHQTKAIEIAATQTKPAQAGWKTIDFVASLQAGSRWFKYKARRAQASKP